MTRATNALEDLWRRITDLRDPPTDEEMRRLEEWSANDVSEETGIPLSSVQSAGPDFSWQEVWERSSDIRRQGGEDNPHDPAFDQQAFEELFG